MDIEIGPSQAVKLWRDKSGIAPYRWRAEYRDGGRLRQFDVDGLHHAHEIDLARVRRLVIEGHPAGELHMDTVNVPSAVIIEAHNRLQFSWLRLRWFRWVWFGFRFPGGEEAVVIIEPDGHVHPR